jgi:hypothetical protein
MKTYQLIALALGLAASPLVAQTADDYIAQGRTDLTVSNIFAANTNFSAAVALSPTNGEANALLAATRLLVLPQQTAGSNFLGQLGFPAAGRNIYDWTSQMPVDTNGDTIWPANYNSSTGIAFYLATIMPALAASATNLANITDPNFTLSLSESETSIQAVTLDYGDIQMLRALVAAGQFLGYTINAQNADVVIPALVSMSKTNGLTIQAVLADYPSLLTLSSSADLASSKGALTNAIALYFAASDFIRNVRPPGGQYLFNLDADEVTAEANFRTNLTNALLSVSGPVQVDPPQTFSIDAANYFSGAKTLRSLMPQFMGDRYVNNSLPDYTFGGVLLNEPACDVESLLRKEFGKTCAGIYTGSDSYGYGMAAFVDTNQLAILVGGYGYYLPFVLDQHGDWNYETNDADFSAQASQDPDTFYFDPQDYYLQTDGSFFYSVYDYDTSAGYSFFGSTVPPYYSGGNFTGTPLQLEPFRNSAGYYTGTWSFPGESGKLVAILAADGEFAFTSLTSASVPSDGGYGQLDSSDGFSVQTVGGSTVTGTLTPATLKITGSFTPPGSTTSGTWTLSRAESVPFDLPPAITTPPKSATNSVGGSTTLTVTATGSAPLCYQWYCNGTAVNNATNTSLAINNLTLPINENLYSVSVRNAVGGTNSAAVTITVVDTTKPTVSVTNLAAGQDISNSVFVVKGTAGDNSGLTAVWYQLNNGNWTLATTTNGWTNWWADLTLAPGTNILSTYSVDNAGHDYVYAADNGNNLIRKVTPAGIVSTPAGDTNDLVNGLPNSGYTNGTNGAAEFYYPTGVAVDGSGNVLVADSQNNLVRKVTPAGVVTTLAGDTNDLVNGLPNSGYADGANGAAKFNYPGRVAMDHSGNIYVADSGNNLIRKITPAGVVTTLAGDTNDLVNGLPNSGYADGTGGAAQFSGPTGVAVDSAGNVYVADNANSLIRKVTPAGVVTTMAGDTNDLVNGLPNYGYADGTNGAVMFNFPISVAVDGWGNIIVADSENSLIREITPAGVVSTLAGDAQDLTNGFVNYGYADGTGSTAQFNYPDGVAVDVFSNVYVADYLNNLIRKITPAGVVSTPAGDTQDLTNGLGLVNYGYADGIGGAAKFDGPAAVAVDESGGNISTTDTVTFVYVVSGILQVQATGQGTISPNYSNAVLQINKSYTVTATAAAGFAFTNWILSTNWVGDLASNKAALNFTMESNLTLQVNFVDTNKPVLTITNPPANATFSNSPAVTVKGTATDNVAVASVSWRLGANAWNTAAGTNNWQADVTLAPGTNVFSAYAVDTSGNDSTTNSLDLIYWLVAPVTVQTNGPGTVSPNYNGQTLIISNRYTMTATVTAGKGFMFANWTGGTSLPLAVLTNGATVQFMMVSNLTLQANFVDTNKPVLTITNPAANAHFTNTSVSIQGTATDNVAVASVFWRLGTNMWNTAAGTNRWTAPVNPVAGTNVFSAYAADTSGNLSTTSSVSIVYSGTFTPVVVETSGEGTVTPDYNGQSLGVGQTYSMTAAGTNGFILTNWAGGTNLPLTVLTNGPAVTFSMRSNLTLEANFADVQPPTIAITNSLPGGALVNLTATVGGTAADNDEVTAVMYQLNGGAWTAATGTNLWSAAVNLSAGTNVFSAYSVDEAGNVSATNTIGSFVSLLQPVITGVTLNNHVMTVYFSSVQGATYSLVYKSTLGASGWTPLAGSAGGTGGGLSLSDTNPPDAERFYRLEAQP